MTIAVSTEEIDGWVQQVRQCKYLPEADLKKAL